jgi:alpha-beta hydrolase superfamily lysophospholipase
MSTSQPVIVLVHGAWADATSWNSVLSELQDRGFTVYAPPNPLRGLPQDSAYMHQYLTQNAALQGQPVVLVAHSYGGAVITNAAVDAPEVRALVYVDAFIPDQGDRVIPPAELTFMAKRAGARITDVDAGHLSLISEASVVTRVILEAVQATG